MSTKQKIIIRHFRDGQNEMKISRDLHLNRKTVHCYIEDYRKARDKLSGEEIDEEALIENIVQAPSYNSENLNKRKLTNEIASEIDRLLGFLPFSVHTRFLAINSLLTKFVHSINPNNTMEAQPFLGIFK
jgi:hypothetical protein